MAGLGKNLLLLGAATFAASCGQETATIFLNSSFQVSGFVDLSLVENPESTVLTVDLIGPDGVRTNTPTALVDMSNGYFAVTLNEDKLLSEFALSLPERITAMGTPPVIPDYISGNATDPSSQHCRIEIREQIDLTLTDSSAATTLLYGQARLPIKDSNATTEDNSVSSSASAKIGLARVGAVPVKVIGEDGSPISGASVSVIPLVSENVTLGKNNPILPWEADSFASVAGQTDENGFAFAMPAPAKLDFSRFQVAATRQDYCTQVTGQSNFSVETITTPESLTLKNCEEAFKNEAPFGWGVSFDAATVTAPQSSEAAASIGYLGGSQLTLSMRATGHYLHGFEIKAYKGTEAQATTIASDRFPTFQSSYTLEYGLDFTTVDQDLTDVFIVVKPIATSSEVPEAEQNLSGIYSNIAPSINASQFAVTSSAQQSNIISGIKGATFNITIASESACGANDQLGVRLVTPTGIQSSDTIEFLPCTGTSLTYHLENMTTTDLASGDNYSLIYILKNRFGTNSSEIVDGSNSATVEVDGTLPILADGTYGTPLSFGVEFGVIEASATGSTLTFGATQIKLSTTNIYSYKIAFAEPDSCRILEASNSSTNSNKVADFVIAPTEDLATANDFSSASACGTTGLTLSTDLVTFPSASSESLSFALRVRDWAGNISEARLYSIPSCASAPTADVCWQ